MTVPANKSKKSNIDDGDILCMAWVDLNTVQFMTTVHTNEDLKTSFYKNSRRRHGIPANSRVIVDDEEEKLPFPMPIVEYNQHMGGSDGNAQHRAYYSPQRSDRRYWWCGRMNWGGVRGLLLLGVQENKQTREEQNNRIRTIARLITVSLAPRA